MNVIFSCRYSSCVEGDAIFLLPVPLKRVFNQIQIQLKYICTSIASIWLPRNFAQHSCLGKWPNFLDDWISFLWTIAKKMSSNSEFDWIIFSATGAWRLLVVLSIIKSWKGELFVNYDAPSIVDSILKCIFLKEIICIFIQNFSVMWSEWYTSIGSACLVLSQYLNQWWPTWLMYTHQSALVQVLAWCRQAPSHYLKQCWPIHIMTYRIFRQEWAMVMTWCRMGTKPLPEPMMTKSMEPIA